MPPTGMCTHTRGHFVRVPFRQGGGFHIMERCPVCGGNVRGGGVWVPAQEIKDDPRALPLCPGYRPDRQQGTLF